VCGALDVSNRQRVILSSLWNLPVDKLPEGRQWLYEIKLDGYRLEVVKNAGQVTLYSRRRNVLNRKFPYIAEALAKLPDATVVDGQLVALYAKDRSSFTMLQSFL
jgi:ATP-dependent DNA ligase